MTSQRQVRAAQAKRLAARKRRDQAKRQALDEAWAVVRYVAAPGPGYTAEGLYADKAAAEAAAKQASLEALERAAYIPGTPYTVVFAAPVFSEECRRRRHTRDAQYFVNLRVARGGRSHVASLWLTRAEAEAEAAAPESPGEYLFVGGPFAVAGAAAGPADGGESPPPPQKALAA